MKKRDKILIIIAAVCAVLMIGCGALYLMKTTDEKTVPILVISALACLISLVLFVVLRYRDKKAAQALYEARAEEVRRDEERKHEAELNGELYLTAQERNSLRTFVDCAEPAKDAVCPVCGSKIQLIETRYGYTLEETTSGGGAIVDTFGNTIGYLQGEKRYYPKDHDLKTYGCPKCRYKWHKKDCLCFLAANSLEALHCRCYKDGNGNPLYDEDILDWGDLKKFME